MPLYDYGANNYGLANGSSRKRNATWRRYWLCVRARLRPRRPRCSTTLTMSSAPVRRGCSTASGFKGAIRQDLGAYAREPSIQFIGSLQPSFVDPKTGAQHCRTARCIIVWFLASRRVDGACISQSDRHHRIYFEGQECSNEASRQTAAAAASASAPTEIENDGTANHHAISTTYLLASRIEDRRSCDELSKISRPIS
jgi:hypothetical protein